MGAIEATDTDYQNSWAFETKQIHAGWDRDPQTGATSIPILQTTSFAFDSAERAAARFALQELGPIYTRLGNPTNDYVEARIAALEGGVGALLTSSGQSAITLAVLNLASAGNNIVASPSLYGGSTSLLNNTLRRLGIDARFVTIPTMSTNGCPWPTKTPLPSTVKPSPTPRAISSISRRSRRPHTLLVFR